MNDTNTFLNDNIHSAVKRAYEMTGIEMPSSDDLYFFTRAFVWALHKHGVGFTVQLSLKKEKTNEQNE